MNFVSMIFTFIFVEVFHLAYCYDDPEDLLPPLGSMQEFNGGPFFMGIQDADFKGNGEHPIRTEFTKPFSMDRYPVTNQEFAEFVKKEKYKRTDADIRHYSYVFFSHAAGNARQLTKDSIRKEPWWMPIQHTRWNRPFGPGSNINGRDDYPVVHVGLADADAYCKWKGKRLPTEFEWEYAVRGNNHTWIYPWGDGFRRNRMNIWQGLFPAEDKGWDLYTGVSPVRAYPPQNAHGMYDMLGNVWEWTSTRYYGTDQEGVDISDWAVLKGGSFIDSAEKGVTSIVRCSTKIGRPSDFTAENVGFRCARTKKLEDPAKKLRVIRYEDTWHYKQEKKKMEEKYRQLKRNKDKMMERDDL